MKKVLMIFAIIIVVVLIGLVVGNIINKNGNEQYAEYREKTIQDLYKYGEEIEKMDVLPNTVVAKFNGEEILFHEIESYRNSINYSIENGSEEAKDLNAFYEVLKNKLYSYLAKTYPNAVNYGLDIEATKEKTRKEWLEGYGTYTAEEQRSRWLEVLYIEEDEIWLAEEDFIIYLQHRNVEQKLQSKGMRILFDFMIQKPELANDEELNNKVEKYKKLQNKEKKLIEENKTEEALELTREHYDLLTEIQELYIKDLIANSDIELCIEKRELSTKVPEIYNEEE